MIPMHTIPGYENTKPGIQVATKLEGQVTVAPDGSWKFDEDGIRFLRQMGIEWVMVNHEQVPEHSARGYKRMVEELGERGLKIYRLANNDCHNMPAVTLGLPDRQEKTDRYLRYIRDLGEAGIRYATYAHMGNGIWRSDFRRPVRGGATAGGLDLQDKNHGFWGGELYYGPVSSGRVYSEEELWENYETFIRQVVPVAESAGVYIGVHPDDPPVYPVGGVPRCVFGTFEGYKKAIDIADSPNIGTCLCVGCWLEGGTAVGSTPEEFIRYFAQRKKLFKLHLRNVTAPLDAPGGFNETYPDAGYYNLINVLEALRDVDFDGCIINDHLIDMVGGHKVCESYFTSYLKGAVDAVMNARKEA